MAVCDAVRGVRVIRATVIHDDVRPEAAEETHDVEGWDENAILVAMQWAAKKMAQLSM